MHIHARVGFEEGPQVNDPRSPEWLAHLEGFEVWWDLIWNEQRKSGMTITTCTPEHGAPTYQHTVPYTKQPLADVWEVNTWIGERQKKRFEASIDSVRTLRWNGGELEVQRLGAMAIAHFEIGNRIISPMHVSPWANDAGIRQHPPILQRLRGDFCCVPMGYACSGLLPGWEHVGLEGEEVHGPSSNQLWDWIEEGPAGTLALRLRYPNDHSIERLERRLTPSRSGFDVELTIVVRKPCSLPLGLHPVFCLPSRPGAARIETPATLGHTYPGVVEPGAQKFASGCQFTSLSSVPALQGGNVDASRLPFDGNVEELLQLHHTNCIALVNEDEKYRVRLQWEQEVFPSVLLWISNRGRTASPWNGRHLALGMEPVCSPFGLGPELATRDNPLSMAGIPTCHVFEKAGEFRTRYRIEVEELSL